MKKKILFNSIRNISTRYNWLQVDLEYFNENTWKVFIWGRKTIGDTQIEADTSISIFNCVCFAMSTSKNIICASHRDQACFSISCPSWTIIDFITLYKMLSGLTLRIFFLRFARYRSDDWNRRTSQYLYVHCVE